MSNPNPHPHPNPNPNPNPDPDPNPNLDPDPNPNPNQALLVDVEPAEAQLEARGELGDSVELTLTVRGEAAGLLSRELLFSVAPFGSPVILPLQLKVVPTRP